MEASVVVIGGGPAGAAAARLLASWGHRVLVLHKPADRLRGLAESLPPSTLKLFDQIGVLDRIQQASFYRTSGNTVWWGSEDCRVETFGRSGTAGLQVFRPELDRILLESALAAGADVRARSVVHAVRFEPDGARVEFEHDGRRHTASCRFVLDSSGRTGIIGRRFRQPLHRMYALVGAWNTAQRWDLPDETHTVVEASNDGWAWSVPISASTRHVGLMVDGVPIGQTLGTERGRLADTYVAQLAGSPAHHRLVNGATLGRVWACDASTYSASEYAGAGFLLVGDAGSFIDPLSSFGVKKALASACVAAVVVNTYLARPKRAGVALDFFSELERDVSLAHAQRSQDFAREAYARYPSRFWSVRANAPAPASTPVRTANADVALQTTALQTLKASVEIDLTMASSARLTKRPVIRGREIVLEDAFADGSHAIRFRENVDLVQLAAMACRHRQVADLFEAYCRTHGPVPFPSVLGGLSLLVAKGILNSKGIPDRRNVSPC